MVSPTVPQADRHLEVTAPMIGGGSTKLTFRFLDSISVLGNKIDDVGSADTQLQNRLASADRAVWLKMQTW